jgi:hypothetical protein
MSSAASIVAVPRFARSKAIRHRLFLLRPISVTFTPPSGRDVGRAGDSVPPSLIDKRHPKLIFAVPRYFEIHSPPVRVVRNRCLTVARAHRQRYTPPTRCDETTLSRQACADDSPPARPPSAHPPTYPSRPRNAAPHLSRMGGRTSRKARPSRHHASVSVHSNHLGRCHFFFSLSIIRFSSQIFSRLTSHIRRSPTCQRKSLDPARQMRKAQRRKGTDAGTSSSKRTGANLCPEHQAPTAAGPPPPERTNKPPPRGPLRGRRYHPVSAMELVQTHGQSHDNAATASGPRPTRRPRARNTHHRNTSRHLAELVTVRPRPLLPTLWNPSLAIHR